MIFRCKYFDCYYFQSQDIIGFFSEENILTVIAYNYGTGLHYQPHTPAGFILQMEIDYQDGSSKIIITDDTWKIAIPRCWEQAVPQMFWTTGFQEIVDFHKYQPDFLQLNFNDCPWSEREHSENNTDPAAFSGDTWDYAVTIGVPPVASWHNLIPRDIPKLTEVESQPVKIIDYGFCTNGQNQYQSVNIADLINQEEHLPPENAQKVILTSEANAASLENLKILPPEDDHSVFIVFDFGKEVIGHPGLEFSAEADGSD